MKTTLLHTLTACIAVCLSLLLWQTVLQPQSIVSFDMQKTIKSFSAQLAKSDLTPSNKKSLSAKFTQALISQSGIYAKSHNAIVLVSPAVISGTNDVTHIINQMVQHKLAAIDLSGVN